MLRIGHQFRVSAIHQIHWRHLEAVWITPAILQPQSDTNRAGKGFLIARWHLQDFHFALSFDPVRSLFTLSQLDDFILDARGDLAILALQLTQFEEFA
jgi:hypothetical protein